VTYWCFCLQVGIVGRTGSGKTTLLMALFRMISLAGGRIMVDGVDIGNMPLREVRLAALNWGSLMEQPLTVCWCWSLTWFANQTCTHSSRWLGHILARTNCVAVCN
jgi:ABC-type cobalamin/Fe3+-siderophores transport system ATPase subunit